MFNQQPLWVLGSHPLLLAPIVAGCWHRFQYPWAFEADVALHTAQGGLRDQTAHWIHNVFASLSLSGPFHRMFTMTRELKNALREHFIHQKLEISYAIFKPFPFFEGLRDKSFITDKMYMVSHVDCLPRQPSPHRECLIIEVSNHKPPGLLEFRRPQTR